MQSYYFLSVDINKLDKHVINILDNNNNNNKNNINGCESKHINMDGKICKMESKHVYNGDVQMSYQRDEILDDSSIAQEMMNINQDSKDLHKVAFNEDVQMSYQRDEILDDSSIVQRMRQKEYQYWYQREEVI